MLLGEKIKHLREAEGLNQKMLAKNAGVHQSLISQVENGYFTTLGPEALHKLSLALNTTIEYLSGESWEVTSMERMNIEYQKIAKEIRKVRESNRMSQRDVAGLLKISMSHYNRFEIGRIDIRKDRYTALKSKLIDLFPELEKVFNPESEVEEMKTNNIITEESDKDQFTQEELKAMVNGEEVAVDVAVNNNDYLKPGDNTKPITYELDDQTRETACIVSKNQADELKEFYKNSPKPNNDQFVNLYENPDNNINDTDNLQLPKELLGSAKDRRKSFINSLFNQKEQLSPERLHFNITADSNFQLLLFDYIHEKIMYYVRERKPITQYEYNLIVAEIDRYKGISSDAGNILELKLSKLEITPEVKMKNDNPLSKFIGNLVNASGCDIDGDIFSIKFANGNTVKAFIDAQNDTIRIIDEK